MPAEKQGACNMNVKQAIAHVIAQAKAVEVPCYVVGQNRIVFDKGYFDIAVISALDDVREQMPHVSITVFVHSSNGKLMVEIEDQSSHLSVIRH